MRFVILHYHVFKNAGSTIEDILDHSFGERFGTLETPVGGGLISNEELIGHLDANPHLRAFSSHQIRYPKPEMPGYLFFDICFLRDPIDRLRSFYDYFRQKPNPADPMSELANRSTLGQFVAGMIADHALFVRNNQVNLLACGGDSDEPGERDFEVARQRVMSASFLGVVDCFEQSAVVGSKALRCALPELDCSRPAVNVSRGLQGSVASRSEDLGAACRPEVYEELLRITELDRRLVDLARAEVLRRYEAICVRPRLRAARIDPIPELKAGTRDRMRLMFERPDEIGPLFDAGYYARKYADVGGANPLVHYLKRGRKQLRQPNAVFDPAFYLERNPDVRAAGIDPLLHYISHGAAEDRKPHPLFEPAFYRASFYRASRGEAAENLLVHFLNCGVEAASPHPLFDCEAYLDAHPSVQKNPLVHYLEWAVLREDGLKILDVAINDEPQQQPFLRAAGPDQIRVQYSSDCLRAISSQP